MDSPSSNSPTNNLEKDLECFVQVKTKEETKKEDSLLVDDFGSITDPLVSASGGSTMIDPSLNPSISELSVDEILQKPAHLEENSRDRTPGTKGRSILEMEEENGDFELSLTADLGEPLDEVSESFSPKNISTESLEKLEVSDLEGKSATKELDKEAEDTVNEEIGTSIEKTEGPTIREESLWKGEETAGEEAGNKEEHRSDTTGTRVEEHKEKEEESDSGEAIEEFAHLIGLPDESFTDEDIELRLNETNEQLTTEKSEEQLESNLQNNKDDSKNDEDVSKKDLESKEPKGVNKDDKVEKNEEKAKRKVETTRSKHDATKKEGTTRKDNTIRKEDAIKRRNSKIGDEVAENEKKEKDDTNKKEESLPKDEDIPQIHLPEDSSTDKHEDRFKKIEEMLFEMESDVEDKSVNQTESKSQTEPEVSSKDLIKTLSETATPGTYTALNVKKKETMVHGKIARIYADRLDMNELLRHNIYPESSNSNAMSLKRKMMERMSSITKKMKATMGTPTASKEELVTRTKEELVNGAKGKNEEMQTPKQLPKTPVQKRQRSDTTPTSNKRPKLDTPNLKPSVRILQQEAIAAGAPINSKGGRERKLNPKYKDAILKLNLSSSFNLTRSEREEAMKNREEDSSDEFTQDHSSDEESNAKIADSKINSKCQVKIVDINKILTDNVNVDDGAANLEKVLNAQLRKREGQKSTIRIVQSGKTPAQKSTVMMTTNAMKRLKNAKPGDKKDFNSLVSDCVSDLLKSDEEMREILRDTKTPVKTYERKHSPSKPTTSTTPSKYSAALKDSLKDSLQIKDRIGPETSFSDYLKEKRFLHHVESDDCICLMCKEVKGVRRTYVLAEPPVEKAAAVKPRFFSFKRIVKNIRSVRLPNKSWQVKLGLSESNKVIQVTCTDVVKKRNVQLSCFKSGYELIFDGKHFTLVGAPEVVDSLQDLSVLLNIVNNIGMDDPVLECKK